MLKLIVSIVDIALFVNVSTVFSKTEIGMSGLNCTYIPTDQLDASNALNSRKTKIFPKLQLNLRQVRRINLFAKVCDNRRSDYFCKFWGILEFSLNCLT